jgi:hypothetical protein
MPYIYGLGEFGENEEDYVYGAGNIPKTREPDVPPYGFALYQPRVIPDNIKDEDWPDELGNIDVAARPKFQNDDGSISTERSFSVNLDGQEVLLPQIIADEDTARLVTKEEAIEHYKRTGEHLGKFNDVDKANRYAQKLHEWQELDVPKDFAKNAVTKYGDKPIPLSNPNPWGKPTAAGSSGRPEFAPAQFAPNAEPAPEPDALEGMDEEEKEDEERIRRLREGTQPTTEDTEAAEPSSHQPPPGLTYDQPAPGITPDNQPQPAPTREISYQGNLYPNLAERRKRLIAEIDNNPRLRDAAAAVVSQEGRGKDTILGIVEALVNRADMRGTSITRELTNGFYGPVVNGHVNRVLERNGGRPEKWMLDQFDEALDAVRNGSDLIEGRTDQGGISPRTGRPEIVGPATMFGSEYFGDMGGDPTWRMRHQRSKGDPGPGATRERIDPTQAPTGLTYDQGGTGPQGITYDQPQTGAARNEKIPRAYAPKVNPELVSKLDELQQDFGRQFHINSGYRSPRQNLEAGGEKASEHLSGNALDIDVSDMSKEERIKLIEQASARGVTGIGVYNTALHFDLGNRRAWGPDHHRGSIPDWAAPVLARHMANKATLQEGPGKAAPAPTTEDLQKGRPQGITVDTAPVSSAPGITPDTPVSPEAGTQTLPSGEIAPVSTEAQREAVAALVPAEDAVVAARQMLHKQNRERLLGDIQEAEKAGYPVKHFIGTPGEPEGDRAPTMDMEALAKALRKQAKDAAAKGKMDVAAEAGKKAQYWEDEVEQHGMSAEQWKKQTGEDFPHGPLPVLSPTVARQLGIEAWIDQASGAEVRRAHLAKKVEEPEPQEEALFPGDLTPGQVAIQKRRAELKKEQDELIGTLIPGDIEKQKKIEDLNKEIAKQDQAFSEIQSSANKTREQEIWDKATPAQRKDIISGKQARKEAFSHLPYAGSVAAHTAQQFERESFSILKGTQDIQEKATRKFVNPYKTAEEAKAALPTLESQRKIFQDGIDELNKAFDPSDKSQQARMNAYTNQVADLSRKIDFAKARIEGKSGEGIGATLHKQAEERMVELEKQIPEQAKKWDKFIDQSKKNDLWHSLFGTVGGSLPSTLVIAGTSGGIGLPAGAVIGFLTIFSSEYSNAKDEYAASMKEQGKPIDKEKQDAHALARALSNTPMEEIGDLMGAKAFGRFLALTRGMTPKQIASFIEKNPVWKQIGKKLGTEVKELGPTILAEGLFTNSTQSIMTDVIDEKYGVAQPTTLDQKVTKAVTASGLGAGSAIMMWGLPTTAVAMRRAIQQGRAAQPPVVPSAGPVAPGVIPGGTLTGAAAQMGGGAAPYTTPPVAPLPTTAPAAAPRTATTTAPGAPSPVEPSEEVVKTTSRKGEPVEKTVYKNQVQIEPGEKEHKIHYYDDTGNKQTITAKNEEEAVEKAEKIVKANNLAGYYDAGDQFVRKAGAPKPGEVVTATEVAPEPAPVAQDAPEADQKARAKTVWDNSKVGDVYTWTSPSGVPYRIEIKANKKGERQAVVTSTSPEYAEEGGKGEVTTIGIDSKTAKPTEGDGLVFGAGMVREAPEGTTTTAAAPEEGLPGPTQEQLAAAGLLGGKIKKPAPMWLQKLSHALGIDFGGVQETRRQVEEQLNSIDDNQIRQAFLNFKIGDRTIQDLLNEKVKPFGTTWDLNDRDRRGSIGGVYDRGALFSINPRAWLADLLAIPEDRQDLRDKSFHDALNEEVIHIAQEAAWNRDFNNLSRGERQRINQKAAQMGYDPYNIFRAEKINQLINDLESATNALPMDQRKQVYKMLKDWVNTYHVPLDMDRPSDAYLYAVQGFGGRPERIFSFLRGNGNVPRVGTILEMLRMVQQARRTGTITEDTAAKITNPISKWFKNLIRDVMRGFNQMFGPGQTAAGKTVADTLKPWLDKVDAILNDPELGRETISMVNPYPEGPQLDGFRGRTTVDIDNETGKHMPVYHVNSGRGSAAAGLGISVAFRHDVFKEAMKETKDYNKAMAYIMMPLWVRLERPARLSSIGPPAQHAALKEMLQKQGYDGIVYPGGFIVFDPTQLISAAVPSSGNMNIQRGKAKNVKSFENTIVTSHNNAPEDNVGSSTTVEGPINPKEEVWMVGVYPELVHKVKGRFLTEQDAMDFVSKLRSNGVELNTGALAVGTWYDRKNDETVFDVSAKVPDMRAALVIGQEMQQEAVWDNLNKESIYLQHSPQVGGLPAIGERFGFLAGKAKNIDLIIGDQEMMDKAETQQQWKDWYFKYDDFMRLDFIPKHPEYGPVHTTIIAATSPMRDVPINIRLSMQAFANLVNTGDARGILGTPEYFKWDTHGMNLSRLSRGEEIKGEKVGEFLPASMGDPYAIAVDRHVGNVLFGTENPSDAQKFAGQKAIVRVADRMGWKWAELQASLYAVDIVNKNNQVQRYEWFLNKYQQEFLNLVDADLHAGGKVGELGRQILERVSKRKGPERLLGLEAGHEQAIREARAGAILDPYGRPAREMEMLRRSEIVRVDPVVSSLVSFRGPPGMARGKSKSSKAPATTAYDIRVPNATLRIPRMWNGAKQVMWNSPGCAGIGDCMHKHVDLRKKVIGEATAPFVRWERSMFGVPNLPWNLGKPTMKRAINEHTAWRKAKAGGQPLPKLSPAAKRLKDTYDGVFAKINLKNSAAGVKVKNPATGKYQPIPNVEYPAKIRNDIMSAMRDPHNNQTAYRELWDGLVAEGILPKGATDKDVDAHIAKVLEAYKSNGAFSNFFFFPKTMPSIAFDYSYNATHEFLLNWSERYAQHQAFGANPENDIFDAAIAKTRDEYTEKMLKLIKQNAYGNRINDLWGRFSVLFGHLAAAKHLAGFTVAAKNLMTGMGYNFAALGPINFTKAFFTTVPFRAHIDAIERGILVRDLPNVMTDGDKITAEGRLKGAINDPLGMATKAAAAAAQKGLQISGFNAAETWNRGVAMRGLESMLRQALKSYQRDRRSGNTLRWMAYFQRMGFRQGRAELLMQENGKGELTDEFLRAGVNQIHGGYTYADVPVYMETPLGRALFKYQKWGAERTKNVMREVAKPALRAIRVGKAETIQVIDPATGKPMDVKVPRSVKELMPLAYYIVAIAGAAAGDEWILENLFSLHPKTISLAKALQRYREGGWGKFNDFIEKLWMLNMHAGALGVLGNYIQDGLAFFGVTERQGPEKSISESVPALDPFLEFADFIMTAKEQGWQLGAKDWDNAFNSISFYRTSKQLGLTAFHRLGYKRFGNDVIGQLTRQSELMANKQDLAVVKTLKRRWMEETKQQKKGIVGGRMQKDPASLWKEPLDDALSIGDLPWARQILRDAKATMSPARWEAETENLKKHILAKHPLGEGAAAQAIFMDWARQKNNATPYQLATMRRMQRTYEQSARQLSLGMEFNPPSVEDIAEKRQMIQLKAQPLKRY